jgi:uncharacterized OB-fold protein
LNKYTKPLPSPTPWSKPFWDGCKRHELWIQHCNDCGTNIMYPKYFCPECMSYNLGWIKASGKGRVYTYATVYNYQPAAFAEDGPYTVAVIKLEEGVQMMSNIVDCDPERVKCDMEVEITFDDVTEGFTLPRFKPASRHSGAVK